MKLPTFEEAANKSKRSALETFIYEYEPADAADAALFRERLQVLMDGLESTFTEFDRYMDPHLNP